MAHGLQDMHALEIQRTMGNSNVTFKSYSLDTKEAGEQIKNIRLSIFACDSFQIVNSYFTRYFTTL